MPIDANMPIYSSYQHICNVMLRFRFVGQQGFDGPTEDSSCFVFFRSEHSDLHVCTAFLSKHVFSFGSLLSTDCPGGERRLLTSGWDDQTRCDPAVVEAHLLGRTPPLPVNITWGGGNVGMMTATEREKAIGPLVPLDADHWEQKLSCLDTFSTLKPWWSYTQSCPFTKKGANRRREPFRSCHCRYNFYPN